MMRFRLWLLLTLLLVVSSSVSATSEAPYLYYFSDILHAFVIERADGTDSRQIGRDVIPEGYNSADGAGWSPSGRWLAFSANRSRYGGATSAPVNGIISADGLTFIPLDARGEQTWSPVEDLLVYAPHSELAHLQIIDPNLNQVVYEHVFAGAWDCSDYKPDCPVVWSDDGLQLAFSIRQDGSKSFYTVHLPEFRLEEIPDFGILATRTDNLVVYVSDGGEIGAYDLFTHQEWRYSQNIDPTVRSSISPTFVWNSQHTQAILEVAYYRSVDTLFRYYWFVPDQEPLVPITENVTYEQRFEELLWSPDGNQAAFFNRQYSRVVNFPSLEQVPIPITVYFGVWLGSQRLLVKDPTTGSNYIFNTSTSALEQFDLSVMDGDWFSVSPDFRYVQTGDYIYDLTTDQQVARSRLSGNPFGGMPIWNEVSDWVIFAQTELSLAVAYESLLLNNPTTRELTDCYGWLCAGWLPAAVEVNLAQDSAARSVVPYPIQVFTAESGIQRVTWSEDSARIQIITSTQETNPSVVTEWELATGTTTRSVIPYCSGRNCILARDMERRYAIEQASLPLLNNDGSYRLIFDPQLHSYVVQDAATDAVVQDLGWYGPDGQLSFTWLENTLIMFVGDVNGYYNERWHPSIGMSGPAADPLFCEFSPDRHYLLMFPVNTTHKAFLVDTRTGEETRINFYAREGMFSPDGTRLALSSHDLLTIWDVQEILSGG